MKAKRPKSVLLGGTQSNLVGMWALIFSKADKNIIRLTVFVCGKCGSSADGNDYYIVQAINSLTGEPNTAKIFRVSEMTEWLFLPDLSVVNEVFDDYTKQDNNHFRYHWPEIQ